MAARRTQNGLCVGYVRVSTDEQGESGLGLTAQGDAIRAACTYRGWTLVDPIQQDVASGKSRAHRPALAEALRMVSEGEADTLMVAKLDRLARSVLDFCTIAADAERSGWNLVVLDPPVDFTDPSGRLLAHIMASFAEWERAIIGQRTRAAMAVLKAQGVQLGRPLTVGADVRDTILAMRAAGDSYGKIAKHLDEQGIPTGHGAKRWYSSAVRAVEKR